MRSITDLRPSNLTTGRRIKIGLYGTAGQAVREGGPTEATLPAIPGRFLVVGKRLGKRLSPYDAAPRFFRCEKRETQSRTLPPVPATQQRTLPSVPLTEILGQFSETPRSVFTIRVTMTPLQLWLPTPRARA